MILLLLGCGTIDQHAWGGGEVRMSFTPESGAAGWELSVPGASASRLAEMADEACDRVPVDVASGQLDPDGDEIAWATADELHDASGADDHFTVTANITSGARVITVGDGGWRPASAWLSIYEDGGVSLQVYGEDGEQVQIEGDPDLPALLDLDGDADLDGALWEWTDTFAEGCVSADEYEACEAGTFAVEWSFDPSVHEAMDLHEPSRSLWSWPMGNLSTS